MILLAPWVLNSPFVIANGTALKQRYLVPSYPLGETQHKFKENLIREIQHNIEMFGGRKTKDIKGKQKAIEARLVKQDEAFADLEFEDFDNVGEEEKFDRFGNSIFPNANSNGNASDVESLMTVNFNVSSSSKPHILADRSFVPN
jgi:hypothetical protein